MAEMRSAFDQMTHQFLNRRLEVNFEQAPLQSVARHVDVVAAGDARKAGRQYTPGETEPCGCDEAVRLPTSCSPRSSIGLTYQVSRRPSRIT